MAVPQRKPTPKIRLTLHHTQAADFRKSEQTMLAEIPAKIRRELTPDLCVCFVSGTGTQVQFVWPPEELGKLKSGRMAELVVSAKVRVTGGRFTERSLPNLARRAGINLSMTGTLEDQWAHVSK